VFLGSAQRSSVKVYYIQGQYEELGLQM